VQKVDLGSRWLTAALAVQGLASASSAAVVIWSADATWAPASGGNGHRYEAVLLDAVVTWTAARDIAISRGGHLATLTSSEENAFVFSSLASNPALWDSVPTSMADGPYIGGFHPGGAGGSWHWVTGESWSFAAWAPGEPNGIPGGEQGLSFWNPSGPASTWFDHPPSDPTTRSLIVEYAIPAPAVAAPLLLAGTLHRTRRCRRDTQPHVKECMS
jgi:hypothetical protein